MSIDVTDATFETDVIQRSHQTPVVIDLWAEWCGPCKTLGPILELVVGETGGQVVLAKVDVDANPQVAGAFRVQSIPAVFGMRDGKVVDTFVGAQPESAVREFVARLLPTEADNELAELLEAGDEASLRKVLDEVPDHEAAIIALGELLVTDGRHDEALELLARIPETPATRHLAALARAGGPEATIDVEARLDALLDQVKGDDAARVEFVDLLELLGPDDPRTAAYRRQLTARLY